MPEFLAPNKSGRPKKKNARKMGIMDHIASAGKRKRKKRMFCLNRSLITILLSAGRIKASDRKRLAATATMTSRRMRS
jgi:hypothetical protein